MNAYQAISDHLLIEAFVSSVEMDLDVAFQWILYEEIRRRNIELDERTLKKVKPIIGQESCLSTTISQK